MRFKAFPVLFSNFFSLISGLCLQEFSQHPGEKKFSSTAFYLKPCCLGIIKDDEHEITTKPMGGVLLRSFVVVLLSKENLPNLLENKKLHHFFVFTTRDLKIGVCASLLMQFRVLRSDFDPRPFR